MTGLIATFIIDRTRLTLTIIDHSDFQVLIWSVRREEVRHLHPKNLDFTNNHCLKGFFFSFLCTFVVLQSYQVTPQLTRRLLQGPRLPSPKPNRSRIFSPRFFLPLLLFVLLPVAENLLHSGLIQGLNPIVAPYFVFYSNSDRAPNGEMSFGCVRGSGKIRKRGHSLYLRPN